MDKKELMKMGQDFLVNAKANSEDSFLRVLNKYRATLDSELYRRECDADELALLTGMLHQRHNTPLTAEFHKSVDNEAAYQKERWGKDHDDRKTPEDWFWVLGFLAGKALNDVQGKRKHHIIAAAALLKNWYEHLEE